VTIELTLDETSTAFTGTTTASPPSFSWESVKYIADVVTVDEQLESLTRQAYEQGRLRWNFESWRMSPFESNSINYDLRIETLDNSCKALLICPRDAARLTDLAVDSFERTKASITDIQYQVGANLLEKFNCQDGGPVPYMELEKMIEHTNNGQITPSNWDSTHFMLALNLQIVHDDSFLSGYSSRGQILVRVTRSAQTPASVSYFTFVLHDVIVVASPDGVQVLY
jgi:hypothetical protein